MSTTEKLGNYLLQGWVMTNKVCQTPGCNVPLMRTPSGRSPVAHICVDCDDQSKDPLSVQTESSSTVSSLSHVSGSSTPPTEVSSTLSSPTFALPPETEESRRRREQSDRASTDIGQRLLQGWTFLGDECPNVRCYGIPLVRSPKDSTKECVSCGGVYTTEKDWAGRERLLPVSLGESTPVQRVEVESTKRENPAESATTSTVVQQNTTHPEPPMSTTLKTLDSCATALETAMETLSQRLVHLSNGQSGIDIGTMGQVADAISRTAQALTNVRALQWSENQR